MINQGINKVIAARDRGQRLSPVQNSGEDNIQDTTVRLQLVYQQVGTDWQNCLPCLWISFERNQLANKS